MKLFIVIPYIFHPLHIIVFKDPLILLLLIGSDQTIICPSTKLYILISFSVAQNRIIYTSTNFKRNQCLLRLHSANPKKTKVGRSII